MEADPGIRKGLVKLVAVFILLVITAAAEL
jgi:hypothetical protein